MRQVTVNRRPIRELGLNSRSAGFCALELLQRTSHLRIGVALLAGLLDDTPSVMESDDSDSNSENGDGLVEVDAAVNLSLEETLGLLCVTKVVAVDRPITLSVFSPQQNRRFLTLDN
jgi:hypothetical protein